MRKFCERWLRTKHGSVSLEYVAILPVLLGLVFGTIDANRAITTYGALRSGSHQALRCLYTVDGKCLNSSSAQERLFNYFSINANAEYVWDEYNYDAQVSWLSYPEQLFTNISATILNQINYTSLQTLARVPYYTSLGTPLFNVETIGLPFIEGDLRNPVFRYTPGGQVRPRNATLPISRNISDIQTDWMNISTFSIPRPALSDSSRRCFTDLAYNSRTPLGRSDLSNACPNPPNAGNTNVALHLQGSVNTSGTRQGILEFRIAGGGNSFYQGGQFIGPGANGPANFYPRGLPANTSHISPDLLYLTDAHGNFVYQNGSRVIQGEFQHGLLPLNFEQNYRIQMRFTEVNGSGSISFRVDNAELYFPQYQEVNTQEFNCQNPLRTPDSAKDCLISPFGPNEISKSRVKEPIEKSYPEPDMVIQPDQSLQYSQQGFEISTTNVDLTAYCPDNNPGLTNSGNFSADAQVVKSLCLSDPNASVQSWSERQISLPDYLFKKANCQTNLQIPSSYTRYAKLQFPQTPTRISLIPISLEYTKELTPLWYQANDPRFNCSQIELSSQKLDENNSSLAADSIFKGISPDLGTCLESLAQAEVDKLDFPPHRHTDLAASLHNSRFSQTVPQTNCTPFRVSYSPGIESKLNSEPLEYPSRPTQCETPGACRAEFVGFKTNSNQPYQIDSEKALKEYARKEIQTLLPGAKFDCTGQNCIDISLTESNLSGKRTFEIQTSTEVPITLFFGKTISISYAESRAWEGNF